MSVFWKAKEVTNPKKRVAKRYSKQLKTRIVRTNLSDVMHGKTIQTTPSRLVHSHPISERGSSFMIQKPGQSTEKFLKLNLRKLFFRTISLFTSEFRVTLGVPIKLSPQTKDPTGWCSKAPTRIPDNHGFRVMKNQKTKLRVARKFGKFHMLKPKNHVPAPSKGCQWNPRGW